MPEFPNNPDECDHDNIQWDNEVAGVDEYVFEGSCLECGAGIFDGYTFEGRTVEKNGRVIESGVSP